MREKLLLPIQFLFSLITLVFCIYQIRHDTSNVALYWGLGMTEDVMWLVREDRYLLYISELSLVSYNKYAIAPVATLRPIKLLGELHATHSRWEAVDFVTDYCTCSQKKWEKNSAAIALINLLIRIFEYHRKIYHYLPIPTYQMIHFCICGYEFYIQDFLLVVQL